jgi:hypothetical protein
MLINIFGFIGTVNPPPGVSAYGTVLPTGLSSFLSNIVKLLIAVAGIYAFFNFVLAGYAFMSAGGDPKKIADAWAKIWQTIIGLLVAAGAFVIAGIIGKILFDDPFALVRLRIFGP